ncbi:Prolactin-releasing peptide receptor [Armadillidium nasatum]|uniref:Prolactin-releasing peptide receptor n=1 Tax=Armadillidium nasatum TaxID=96803 RepID=A0A5N5SPQ7_9CRUS|nr:Prolactin-releasing peptide receptor [Armadillidium nasatum]
MGEWVFGSVLCHLLSWSQGVSVYISTLTLTSIAIDRFFVIIYPFRPRLKLKVCYLIVICIWIFSLTATLPYALYIEHAKYKGRFYCEEFWPSETIRRIFSVFTAVMQFVIPFIIILICYVKISVRMSERAKTKPGSKSIKKDEIDRDRKRRTNRMLISMVTIFGISWLPMNVIHLAGDYYINATRWSYYNLCFFISHVVAMSSTCYNPFLYAWLNENFRKEFQLVLPCFEQDQPTTVNRGQWRSEKTCNGNNETQQEVLNPNALSLGSGSKRRSFNSHQMQQPLQEAILEEHSVIPSISEKLQMTTLISSAAQRNPSNEVKSFTEEGKELCSETI